jgi:hypothetical protein
LLAWFKFSLRPSNVCSGIIARWSSLREHADRAETTWLRIISNKELGAYEALVASDTLSDPEWDLQGLNFFNLIEIAFKKFLITNLDHPVVKRLHGQV